MSAARKKLGRRDRAEELMVEVGDIMKKLKDLKYKAPAEKAGETAPILRRLNLAVKNDNVEKTIKAAEDLKAALAPALEAIEKIGERHVAKKSNAMEPIAKLRARETWGLIDNLEGAGWRAGGGKSGEQISRLMIRLTRCEMRGQWAAARRHADALCEILRPMWREKAIAKRKLWRLTFKHGIARAKFEAILERLEANVHGSAGQLSPVQGESRYIVAAEIRTESEDTARDAAKLFTAYGEKRGTARVSVVKVEEVFQGGY